MKRIEYCDLFDWFLNDLTTRVYQIFPDVFSDERGSFTEVLKAEEYRDLSWIKQINRSVSAPYVCRGMHALKAETCLSKLVECVSGLIYDIIIDARPESLTYKKIGVFPLDSKKANKLFVPIGFLHGFFSSPFDLNGNKLTENIFQYYIGNASYCHDTEFSVGIMSCYDMIIDSTDDIIFKTMFADKLHLMFSEKDTNGSQFAEWTSIQLENYHNFNDIWYKK